MCRRSGKRIRHRLEADGARSFDEHRIARTDEFLELAHRLVHVPHPAAGNAAGEVAARMIPDREQLVDPELGRGLAHLSVVGGSGPAELGHRAEDGHAAASLRALGQVRQRRPHRDRVGVVGVVDQEPASGELARGYLAGGVPGRWAPNVHEALRELDDVVRPGDAVLVKGSLAVGLEALAEALTKVPSA